MFFFAFFFMKRSERKVSSGVYVPKSFSPIFFDNFKRFKPQIGIFEAQKTFLVICASLFPNKGKWVSLR